MLYYIEAGNGISMSKWRVLDSAPYYAMVESGELMRNSSSSILSSFGQFLPYQQPSNSDVRSVLINNSWTHSVTCVSHGCSPWSCHQVDHC